MNTYIEDVGGRVVAVRRRVSVPCLGGRALRTLGVVFHMPVSSHDIYV